ncbi:amino acid permease 6-like [Miscanthus floridulus]|uniref:amino acid permease 6-like n=1 Tax=Miscanthus floridulus TaxID=154761 RepID=UPI003458A22E
MVSERQQQQAAAAGKVAAFNLAEAGFGDQAELLDDDGRERRTGTLVTASAHIITAVIGSGVLSLAWAIAQLGWVIGPVVLLAFSSITWFCSSLLADCYRAPDPVHGKRNYTYGQAVRAYLGVSKYRLCSLAQYINLVGVTIGYTITTAISMGAIKRSNCFHSKGHGADCEASNTTNMIIFAGIQILLSQLPNFHKLWWLSIVAAVMSLAYSSIGLGLSIAKIAGGVHVKTSLTGAVVGVDVTASEKIWKTFQSLGDIAFAYSYSNVLIEIQDTLRSSPPENVVMKKASFIGVSTTTMFYMLCGVLGYAAFGNDAPGNFLTGFGFYDPFWLIDVGNVCIAVHLIGAYQVFCQPIYQFVEAWARSRWPDAAFLNTEHTVAGGRFSVSPFRLVWRTAYVVVTALVAMVFPFFNDFLGLIGAVSFWPLTVYFPIQMYMAQAKTRRFSPAWTWMNVLSYACLFVSLLAAAGSVQGLVKDLKGYKPFKVS